MKWQNPLYLWFLVAIPLLIAGIWWYQKRLHADRQKYFEEPLFKNLWQDFWEWGSRLKMISLYIGLAFLVVALAGPKIGTRVKHIKRKGVNLMVALDLSASMNARDVKPSRLKKAKYEIKRMIHRLHGDRIGLVVFTGAAYLQSPMTLDYSAFRLYLNIAKTNQMPNSGTNFSAAMETAAKAFKDLSESNKNQKASKVLLIISDGGNHGQSYSDALSALKKQHVSVYTLGIGTDAGSTIPIYSKSGKFEGYKHDDKGNVVTTKLHSGVLKNIAQKGNGKYYEIQSGGEGINAFLARLSKLQKGVFASKKMADYKNQYQWLAGIGLGFLLISMLLTEYKGDRE
ncbi:MAG TPA: VWA domain-containing protein [Balneolaceae bacterium]|nr:VWA domain-containing protein [Balneolaceae bacterium]